MPLGADKRVVVSKPLCTLFRTHNTLEILLPFTRLVYQGRMSDSMDITLAVVEAVRGWTIEEYIYTCTYSLWVYYCIVTMDEEVSKIWPKIRKVGSILYILIKYPLLICFILDLVVDWRFHLTLSLHTCHQMDRAADFFNWVAMVSIETAVLLCLYALLGAERKHLYTLGIIFVPLFIASIVMSNIMLAYDAYASELSDIEIQLGYACPATFWDEHPLFGTWRWISFARTSLGALLVIVTLITRHRNRTGMLITVIRRDGILYFAVVFVLRFFTALAHLPGIPLDGQYGEVLVLLNAMYTAIVPICAIRLIFNVRKSDDDGIPHAASAILFYGQRRTIQSGTENATQDVANESSGLEMVVKRTGFRA